MKKVLLSLALLCSGLFLRAEILERDQEIIASASEKIADEMLRSFVRNCDVVALIQRADLTPEETAYVRALAACLATGPHAENSGCGVLIAAFLYNNSAHEIVEWKVPVAVVHLVEEAKRAQVIL